MSNSEENSKKVYEYLKNAKVFFVTTHGNHDGFPDARPFGAVAFFEGKPYLATSSKKAVFEQIEQNSQICIVATDPENVWNWGRIYGMAKLDDRQVARDQMLKENPPVADIYKENPDDLSVFALVEGEVEFHTGHDVETATWGEK